MKFGFMLDGPQYAPHYFEAASFPEAVNFLEESSMLSKHFQRSGSSGEDGFYVELWEDRGVERKDMTFSQVSDVYKLYPSRNGRLQCNELVERIRQELPEEQLKRSMQWLADHHTKGMSYLLYGELGWRLGEKELARLGSNILSHMEILTKSMELDQAVALYNDFGLTHADAAKSDLISSFDTFYTVRFSDKPIPSDVSGKDAAGEERWFMSYSDAMNDMAARSYDTDPSHKYSSLYLNGDMCICQMEDGRFKAVKGQDFCEALGKGATQMVLAFIQGAASFNNPSSRFFYPVTTPADSPLSGMTSVMENCAMRGTWDATSALKAFHGLGDIPGKRLDICVFNEDFQWRSHINVLRQEGEALVCGDVAGNYLGLYNHDICDILSGTFDKILPLEKWTVRLVTKGDHYGLNDCLIYDDDRPAVEFYDADYKGDERFGPLGQFTGGRYYLETLQGKDGWSRGTGEHRRELSLMDDVPKWTVSAEDMNVIMDWLDEWEKHLQVERKPSLSDQMKAAEERSEQQKSTLAPDPQRDR